MDSSVDNNILIEKVSRVFVVESVVWDYKERAKSSLVARLEGRLLSEDSAEAYDQLAASLEPLNITPLFRIENGRQVIFLLRGVIHPKPSNPLVNLVLFVLTALSVFLSGVLYTYEGPSTTNLDLLLPHLGAAVGGGLAFTVALLSILLAHEFGHFLVARWHKTAATLPYFIPFPLSYFGTLGAVILQKEAHKNKRVLLDIGLAGPLAGLAVAIPVLLIGLWLSEIQPLPVTPELGISLEGNSILYLLLKYLRFGKLLPDPASYSGVSPFMYWVRYFFTGLPSPLGGSDVMLHPVAWAGWAGLLVTALNLIPVGQLDGGHLVHGLFGEKARFFYPVVLVALGLLGIVWSGWWMWVLLTFFLGRAHAEPLDQITPLDPPRKLLALLGLFIFVLVFTPVPLRLMV